MQPRILLSQIISKWPVYDDAQGVDSGRDFAVMQPGTMDENQCNMVDRRGYLKRHEAVYGRLLLH